MTRHESEIVHAETAMIAHLTRQFGKGKLSRSTKDLRTLCKALQRASGKAPVPPGYVLISEHALREWGKLEEAKAACTFPVTP
jgi:hypothetical protein